jgi:hypothetical protein
MEINYETDKLQRSCNVYFCDSVLKTITGSKLGKIVPSLILDAVQFRHWFLLFDFGDKKVICEDVIEKGAKNRCSYAVWDHRKDCKISFLKTILASPAQIYCIAHNNPLNGVSYSIKDRSCQDWITSMCVALCTRNELNLVILDRMKENWMLNVLLCFFKNRMGNFKDGMHFIS